MAISRIVFLALLTFTLCSAHEAPPSKKDFTNNVPVPTSSDGVNDIDRAWKGRVLNTGAGGGGGGGGVVINNPIPGFGGSAGGYGSGRGSGQGNSNGNVGSGGGGGGGGWVGGIPSFGGIPNYGVPNFGTPNFGVPNYGVPSSGGNYGIPSGGGYGYGGGSGSGSGSGDGGSPPGCGGPWGGSNQPNQPYRCQLVNCGNPYGCPGLTMHFVSQQSQDPVDPPTPTPPSTGRRYAKAPNPTGYAMAPMPTPTPSGYAMSPTPSN